MSPAAGALTQRLLVILALVACSGPSDGRSRSLTPAAPPEYPGGERIALASSFAERGFQGIERLLHDSIIVQPPSPDSAVQGAAAIRYVAGLAAQTRAAESRLTPSMATPEGPFLFEQGTWELRAGNRTLLGHYSLRWRLTPDGWKVVLWRWSRFR